MKHHQGEEKQDSIKNPLVSKEMTKNVQDPWDAKFINKFDLTSLYELTAAANYMHIQSLFMLACGKISSYIYDEPTDRFEEILTPPKNRVPMTL